MSIQSTHRPRRRTAALLAAAVVTAVLTATGVAAATSATPTTTQSATSSATTDRDTFDPGGATPVRDDEQSLSSADADRLIAVAIAAVPDATVYRVETDAGDGAYEAHLTKSDGSLATVKFTADITVIGVEDGMGMGDPALSAGRARDGTTAPDTTAQANTPTASAQSTA